MEKYGKSFKELTFKEKVEHLWEYYRKPALFTIVAAVLLINLVAAMLSPREVNSVDIMLAGQVYTDENRDAIIEQYKEQFDTGLTISVVDWTMATEMELATSQKIALLLTTEELDILGLPPATFDNYLQQTGQEMFMALDEIPQCKELLEEYKDQLVIAGYNKDENFNITEGEKHVYGIKISKLDNFPGSAFGEDIVLGITTTAKDVDKTVEMMRYLLESK